MRRQQHTWRQHAPMHVDCEGPFIAALICSVFAYDISKWSVWLTSTQRQETLNESVYRSVKSNLCLLYLYLLCNICFSLCLFTIKTKWFNYTLTILEPFIVRCTDTKIKANWCSICDILQVQTEWLCCTVSHVSSPCSHVAWVHCFSKASATTATVTVTATASNTEPTQHSLSFYFGTSGDRQCKFACYLNI